MAHTPGPWTIEPIHRLDSEIIITEPGVAIDYDDVDHKEQEANARLIAAAPDLLEACQALLHKLRRHFHETNDTPFADATIEDWKAGRLMLAAIKKATGAE